MTAVLLLDGGAGARGGRGVGAHTRADHGGLRVRGVRLRAAGGSVVLSGLGPRERRANAAAPADTAPRATPPRPTPQGKPRRLGAETRDASWRERCLVLALAWPFMARQSP